MGILTGDFPSKNVRSGDLQNEPGHGPMFGYAPPATTADLRAYHDQGSVCMCSRCKQFREGG
jgi:hypothetical protein